MNLIDGEMRILSVFSLAVDLDANCGFPQVLSTDAIGLGFPATFDPAVTLPLPALEK
jgi:hypothetical protein